MTAATSLSRSRIASAFGAVLLPVALTLASGAIAQTAPAATPSAASPAAPASTAAMAGKASRADAGLLRDIAHANLAEIATGKLALEKATDPAVKTFAQTMVDDHTKALGDVTQLAQAKDVKLPTEPDVKHKAAMAKLKLMSGASFDKSYVKTAGVADHVATEKLLKKTQSGARDGEVKALADKMLPVVQEHLKHARELDGMKK
ncbi:MAG TPA: DUF4142 domain-containing protein [Variovorax sp.]|nr:DUF4142 domain-containing protein [Variovorax sp.]